MTSSGARLRVVLTDVDGNERYAEYSTFSVADEDENFEVVFDDYSGNAGDALTYHSGKSFSTWDADHDTWSGHCAETFFGGWWYGSCVYANLNGLYESPGPTHTLPIGILWSPWEGNYDFMRGCHTWVQQKD